MTAKYETVIVFRPELNEAQVKDEEKKIEGVLKNEGAIEVAAESWGRKDLAYAVKKKKSGTFVCFHYSSNVSDTVKNLASLLRISESVIKFQTHRIADRVRKFKGNPRRAGGDQGDDFMDSVDETY